jgi:hypothetical protein
LADDRDWGFPAPTLRLLPHVLRSTDDLGREIESVSVRALHGYTPDIERLIEDLRSACRSGRVMRQYEAFFSLAAALLCRAHSIDLETACRLLAVPHERLQSLVQQVLRIVSGQETNPEPAFPEASRSE